MIIQVLTTIENTYNRLKSEKTQEELEEIFDIGENFKEKVIKMFHIGIDAADDAVEIFMLTVSVFEQLVAPSMSRSIKEKSSFDQLVSDIVEEVQPKIK